MSERERAFDHFHYEVMLGFQRLSKQEQDIIESASFDILTQMRSVPPQPVRPENKVQKRSQYVPLANLRMPLTNSDTPFPSVKRVLFPLATSGMAYLIEQLGEDVVAAAIKDGKIIPHDASTAGTAAANAAKSGLVAAQGVPSAEVALLQKYGTYGAVFALGMVVAAFAMGKTVMFGDSKNSTAAAAIPTPPPPMTNVALHLYLSGNGTSVTSGDESLVHGQ